MGIIAKYKFDQTVYENFIPQFNTDFTDYRITDEIDTDGYIIRTLGNDSGNLPTLIRFGQLWVDGESGATDKSKSLLEVYECNTSNITSMDNMFRYCSNLTLLDVSNFDTSGVTSMSSMFLGCSSLTSLDVSNFDTSNVTTMLSMFAYCSSLISLDVLSFNTSQVIDTYCMFHTCSSLTSLDLSNFNTSQVNNMSRMFQDCSSLTSLDVSNFDTGQVINMQNMFQNCSSLTSLDVSNFNTGQVTNMGYMFSGCSSLTSLDVSNFNTSQVTNMYYMFYDCSSLILLDVSNFNTSNVTNMGSMFNDCSSLASLDVSNFDTSKVTNMASVFRNCSSLTSLNISGFDTSKVTNMSYMFNNCSSLTSLDVSNFNTSNVTNMENMFANTKNITDMGMIYCNSLTINKIVNLLTTNTTIWYSEDEVNIEELDVLENITYKPYKENKISYEGITLRSLPNGVKDEINVLTGEYIQRVKEIILDSSEIQDINRENDSYISFYVNSPQDLIPYSILISNKTSKSYDWEMHENLAMNCECMWNANHSFGFVVQKTKYKTIDDFKQKFFKDEVKILYELKNPIIHQLDPQSLTPYQDGYISMEAEVNYPSFIYSLPSTNTFYIPKIKNMTQYTLKYPVGSGTVTIGNIQYNVTSDSMLFTTPIEITGDKNSLVFETDDNPTDIMILEGNYSNREVKYFTGINSVINPVITVTNSLTGGSVEYKGNSDIALYSLPNKMSDKLDVLTGYLMRVTGIREYQDGDYELDNVFTDGVNTVYKLDSPLLYKNINFPIPTLNGYGTIELDSDEAIPQFNYRTLSNNYYPIELLEPNTTYTMVGEAQANTTFTLGGTYIGNYSGGKVVVNLGSVTENSLKFSNDIGLENFMLVKGDATNSTLPFYTGIKSVEDISFLIKGYDGQENNLVLDDSIVLRECGGVYDSIDLVNYTMTKRLNEIILVGTEYWSVETSKSVDSNYQLFSLAVTSAKDTKNAKIYCDKLMHKYLGSDTDCVYFENNKLYLCINKHTIGGDNINALKTWLTKNNVKIIYPLINNVKLDLDVVWEITPPTSYETQTEFSSSVALGSLKPMLALTVATTTLEEIVSNLEAQNAQLEEENIATMLALTEVYEMMCVSTVEDVGVESTSATTWSRRIVVTSIGMVYAKLVKRGVKSIEGVPTNLRAEVQYAIDYGLV